MTIDRGPEPPFLKSDIVNLAIEKMEEFYSSTDRSQKRYDFPFNRQIDESLKPFLFERFGGKCGYCEVYINSPEYGVIDRFRPHSGIRDKSEYFEDLYWWLTFKWENLIYCCKECQQFKANYFPITGRRAMSRADDLESEQCLLFDPCADDLEEHFTYDNRGVMMPLSAKGSQTIELLRLNRDSHIAKRHNARALIVNFIDVVSFRRFDKESHNQVLGYLQQVYEKDHTIEFLSCRRDTLLHSDRGMKILGDELNIRLLEKSVYNAELDPNSTKYDHITNDYFPLESIHIQNFKGITDLTINFKEDDIQKKSWLFLLGENGVGKSSILQAIAVGLSADKEFIKPILHQLIKKGASQATITIKERNSENAVITILTKDDIEQKGEFKSFLVGYGSLRLALDEVTKVDDAKISYENLFKPIKPLNDITAWLKDIHTRNPKFFDAIAYSIKQLLPHDFSENELTVNEEIMFKNSEKLFSQLSDGFKSTIILAVDIMMKLSSAKTDMDKMSGIVLIDELGNQLHPRWQMRIVKQLRTVFKNLNFIISTHHPLCLRGAEQGEILLLKNINNETIPITELPDPSSLRVDQILSSEFFGLNSLIDPELEAKFNKYYALLAKEGNINKTEQAELTNLKDELRSQKQLGASLREELMYTVIDTLLASKVAFDKNPLSREQLKTEVVQRVGDIWNKLNIGLDD